jgi:hypothetical protein
MPKFLVVHSYRGSNVRRDPCIDASVVAEAATVVEAYEVLDRIASAMPNEPLFVTDELRRPVERPRLRVP